MRSDLSIAEMAAPKGGLAGFAERALRRALLDGDLEPGTRLIARDLAARIGTSQTPVREALLKLVAMGVIEATPAQSFQVPRFDAARYLEIAAIRKAVEGLAAERATPRVTTADIAALTSIAAAYRDARARNAVKEALHRNREFRFFLYERAGMPTLLATIETLWLMIGPSFNFLFPVDPDQGTAHNYDTVITGLRRGDAAMVRGAIERAIDEGTAIVLAHRAANEAAAERAAS